MTPKQRVLTAIAHRQPDRVPKTIPPSTKLAWKRRSAPGAHCPAPRRRFSSAVSWAGFSPQRTFPARRA